MIHHKYLITSLAIAALLAASSRLHASTYGDNLLGIGASSRALGGTGVALPQDALGALSSNPAALTFLSASNTGELDVETTLFVPHVSAQVGSLGADSAGKTYIIPSLAYAPRPSQQDGTWSFGIAAFGVSGLGVDYRNTALDTSLAPTPYPLVAGLHTELQVLDVAPSASYRVSSQWSIGASLHLDYGSLNLGDGAKTAFGAGVQPGVVYRPSEQITLGLSYVASTSINYKRVTDLDGNGTLDNLKLQSPQELRLGIGYELVPKALLLEADWRWVNWGGAEGYKDFGWKDTSVLALGLQYQAIPGRLAFRAGYSFNGDPVRAEQGWNGTGSPANVTDVQGKWVNNYYYQTFRLVGFPAVVSNHLSLGVSFGVSPHGSLDLGFTHAFRKSVTESGTNLLGAPVTLSSSLSEDSVELAYLYRF